jgi:hypothetical protein
LMTTVCGNRVRNGPSGRSGFNGNCEVVDTLTIISRDPRVGHYVVLPQLGIPTVIRGMNRPRTTLT